MRYRSIRHFSRNDVNSLKSTFLLEGGFFAHFLPLNTGRYILWNFLQSE